jgi:hypothetical protein
MSIDPVIRQNAYGAYGAATGKLGDKGGCVYAWQVINRDVKLARNHPAEVRLRYCHSSLGPEVLADLLTGLSLRGPSTAAPAAAIAYGYPSPATPKGVVIQTAPVDRETAKVSPAAPAFVAGDREEDFKDRTNVRIPMP